MAEVTLKQTELFPEPVAYRDEPMSVCQVVETLGGNVASGQARLCVTEDVHEACWAYFVTAWAIYGQRSAAQLLLRLVARDQAFRPPNWMMLVFAEHRRELSEQFARDAGHGRETDWGEDNE